MGDSQIELLQRAEEVLHSSLDSSAGFLDALRREGVLDRSAVHRIKNSKQRSERNAAVVSDLLASGHNRPYDVLLRALQSSGQYALAATIMDPQIERQTLLECQSLLASQSRRVGTYLDAQTKRRKGKLEVSSPRQPQSGSGTEEEWNPKDLALVVDSTKAAILQMERSKLLIDKIFDILHNSSKTSVALNQDLKDLDNEVKNVLSKAPQRRESNLEQDEERQAGNHEPQLDDEEQEQNEQPKLKGRDEENIAIVNRLKRNLIKVTEIARGAGNEYRKHCRDLRAIADHIRTRRQNLARKIAGKVKIDTSSLAGSESDPIEKQISLLEEELNKYKEIESQATFHLTLHSMQRKLSQKWDDNLTAAEEAIKELNTGKQSTKAQAAMKSTLDEVKSERAESNNLIDDMKKTIQSRKDLLQQAGHASPQVRRRNPGASRSGMHSSGKTADRPETTRIPIKLQQLQEELNEYVELETNSTYKFRSEVSRVKTTSERKSNDLNDHMSKATEQLQSAERERDKYKKLYEQEKLLKGQQMIKRDAEQIIKGLKKKVTETEHDRDRYKKLYEQSRISQGVKVTVKDSYVRDLEDKIGALEAERARFKKMYETERTVRLRRSHASQEKISSPDQ